jgi:hypothetical protein
MGPGRGAEAPSNTKCFALVLHSTAAIPSAFATLPFAYTHAVVIDDPDQPVNSVRAHISVTSQNQFYRCHLSPDREERRSPKILVARGTPMLFSLRPVQSLPTSGSFNQSLDFQFRI